MTDTKSFSQMNNYNHAFFGLWEELLKELKVTYGKNEALQLATRIMEKSLSKSYNATGFEKGSGIEFARVLKIRDNAVGIDVLFPEINQNKIVYQFITDPFPNLKEHYTTEEIYSTFIPFKIRHILGENWTYSISKDIWKNDEITEVIICKNPK